MFPMTDFFLLHQQQKLEGTYAEPHRYLNTKPAQGTRAGKGKCQFLSHHNPRRMNALLRLVYIEKQSEQSMKAKLT
jgi:hypothetical protein